MERLNSSKDYSKWILDGVIYSKRRAAWEGIRRFLEMHPHLNEAQALELIGVRVSPGVVRDPNKLTPYQRATKRCFIDELDLVRMHNCVLSVSSQWSRHRFDELREFLGGHGIIFKEVVMQKRS